MTDEIIFRYVSRNEIQYYNLWFRKPNDINIVNSFNESLLHVAISRGNDEIALDLIEKGINLNHQNNDGETALHYCLVRSNFLVFNAILDKDIDVNLVDKHGNSALWVAVRVKEDNLLIVERLLAKGANPNFKNNYGKSPLDLAKIFGKEELVKFFTS